MVQAHALIIDDDPQNIEVLARLLAASNVSSTAVQDTSQLERILQGIERVDVVFLDLEMPLHTGYQIFTTLQTYFGGSVPIVACTVHSNEIANARKLGFQGFIAKPINGALFSTYLSQILRGEGVWDAS